MNHSKVHRNLLISLNYLKLLIDMDENFVWNKNLDYSTNFYQLYEMYINLDEIQLLSNILK